MLLEVLINGNDHGVVGRGGHRRRDLGNQMRLILVTGFRQMDLIATQVVPRFLL